MGRPNICIGIYEKKTSRFIHCQNAIKGLQTSPKASRQIISIAWKSTPPRVKAPAEFTGKLKYPPPITKAKTYTIPIRMTDIKERRKKRSQAGLPSTDQNWYKAGTYPVS
jgi:hypothetical protein